MSSKDHKILSRRDLWDLGIRFCNKHLIHLERADKFPTRVRLGKKTVGWKAGEVHAWLDMLGEERGQ